MMVKRATSGVKISWVRIQGMSIPRNGILGTNSSIPKHCLDKIMAVK
jgi:hypothetical protein